MNAQPKPTIEISVSPPSGKYPAFRTVEVAWQQDGLAVHRRMRNDWWRRAWTITHVASGLAIGDCDTKLQAVARAKALLPLTDWRGPVDGTDTDLAHSVRRILRSGMYSEPTA